MQKLQNKITVRCKQKFSPEISELTTLLVSTISGCEIRRRWPFNILAGTGTEYPAHP